MLFSNSNQDLLNRKIRFELEKKLNLLSENLEEKDSELKLKDQRIAELKSELLNRDSGKNIKN